MRKDKEKKKRNIMAKKLREQEYHQRIIPDKRKRTKITVADLERDDFEQDELMEEQWKELRESIRRKAEEDDNVD